MDTQYIESEQGHLALMVYSANSICVVFSKEIAYKAIAIGIMYHDLNEPQAANLIVAVDEGRLPEMSSGASMFMKEATSVLQELITNEKYRAIPRIICTLNEYERIAISMVN